MLLMAEPCLATQTWSPTLCAPAETITSFWPALIAWTAAASDTSPNGMSPASVLRTAVPPPGAVRKPVISTPFFLKNPFSRATAYGAP